MRIAKPRFSNEFNAEELGLHIEEACRAGASADRAQRFAVLVLHLERSDRGNALAAQSQGTEAMDEIRLRISEALRTIDRFAVVGLNEIILFLPGVNSQTIITLAGNRLLNALDKAFSINAKTVLLKPAIGCAFFPDHGVNVETLTSAADEACVRARTLPARVDVFRNVGRIERYYELVEELRQALDRNELEVWLQPQISSKKRDYVAAEALIRWPRPVGKEPIHAGLIAEMAENNGLMPQLTDFVLQTALRHLKSLDQKGIAISVGVNLSAGVLSDPELPNRIERFLQIWGVPAKRLTLEVTESSLMRDFEGALKVMIDLKRLGTRLSIDDFGTGYSSLSYLRRMPLDELKIDQVFVRNILNIESDRQITKSVIDLSHTFGLEAVAEGVESREVMDLLINEYQCDILQGYFFSKPIPVGKFIEWWQYRLDPITRSTSEKRPVR
ncbi:MAG: GGDEF domain-containing phosphodiesterase [Burkholderiaceae bacterium]|jgi:EAL domain-containing protein (putative c-di-GMP-specific phosphodiesterase class I)